MNGLGSVGDRRPPDLRGIENGVGTSRNLVDHARRRAGRIGLVGGRVGLKLDVVLVDDDRGRELVREGIERVPLDVRLVGGDEHWKRNCGLGASARLDHARKG